MKKLGSEPHPVLEVEDDAAVAGKRVQPVGAQAIRTVRLHLNLPVESVPHRHERAPHHRLDRSIRRTPHADELPLDEGIFERAAAGARLGGQRADQEPVRKNESLGPFGRGAARRSGAQHRGGIAELERKAASQIEVLVPEEKVHVVPDDELGVRELDAGEEESEPTLVREGEALGLALDRSEPGFLPAIAGEETRDRAFPFQREPAPRRQLEEARVHSESRDLAPVFVEPGLAARLVEQDRASGRRIERPKAAREREASPVAVAVGVVKKVEPEPTSQELRVRVENLARRAVWLLRHRERHLLAQAEEILLLDRHPVVTLAAGPTQGARELRRPRIVRVYDDVDFAFGTFDRLRRDRHGPEDLQEAQVSLGLRYPGRFEQVSLRKKKLAPDDLRARNAVNRVGQTRGKGRLDVLEDVLGLDADAADAWGRLCPGR